MVHQTSSPRGKKIIVVFYLAGLSGSPENIFSQFQVIPLILFVFKEKLVAATQVFFVSSKPKEKKL